MKQTEPKDSALLFNPMFFNFSLYNSNYAIIEEFMLMQLFVIFLANLKFVGIDSTNLYQVEVQVGFGIGEKRLALGII